MKKKTDMSTTKSTFLHYLGRTPAILKLVSLFYCITDPLTPWYVRATGLFAAAYVIFPIDLIPDFFFFLLGLGVMDDMAVLYMAYKMAQNHIQPRHIAKAKAFFRLEDDT